MAPSSLRPRATIGKRFDHPPLTRRSFSLAQRLPRFYECHPDIEVWVSESKLLVEPRPGSGACDVAIRTGVGPSWPGVVSEPLMDEVTFPVCSPAIASRLREPADLAKVTLLHDDDPEWKFDVWSDDTGMDRSPDNHYPTSSLDVIASRPVGQIAAENCLLLLWATAPMLPEAIEVMAGWGFVYKTHAIGRKDRIITGFWLRSRHEILLIGVRGAVPCPAMGEQWESVFDFPVTEHSAKPDFAHRFAERFFPSWPKIELNARETRECWFAWGAEAPATEGEAA